MISETVGCEENEFEVSKSFIFEQGKRSKYIAISSFLSSKENIDQALKNNKIKECESTSCLSLRSSSSYQKL